MLRWLLCRLGFHDQGRVVAPYVLHCPRCRRDIYVGP
jgi:hypothetical protein